MLLCWNETAIIPNYQILSRYHALSNKSKREINQYMGHVTKLWPSCYMALLSTRQPQFRDLTHMINIIEELTEKQKNYCLMMHLSFRTAIKHWIGQWKMFSLHCIVYILVDVSGTWMGRLRSSENLLFSCSRSTPTSVVTTRWSRSPWPMSWCHAEHALWGSVAKGKHICRPTGLMT